METSSILHLVGGTATAAAAGAAASPNDATVLTAGMNIVDAATTTTAIGVMLPAGYPLNTPLFVINATAVGLSVYPQTGGTINGGAASGPKPLAANISGLYIQYGPNKWGAVLSA